MELNDGRLCVKLSLKRTCVLIYRDVFRALGEPGCFRFLIDEDTNRLALQVCAFGDAGFHSGPSLAGKGLTCELPPVDSGYRGEIHAIISNVSNNSMELRINSFIGSMDEEIDIEKEGKDILIGFNPKFFIDALRVIDEEEVSLYMVNPKAPCFIKDDDDKFIYLILPVNFSTM